MIKKTDNHNLAAKVALRRELLKGMKAFSVLDCFSGESEAIWTELRKEFEVSEYLAIDIKRKPGRIAMDSLRLLQGQTWHHDVVDLDAYGSPWEHYLEVLKKPGERVVFLTVGNTMFSGQSKASLKQVGLTFDVPIGMHGQLTEFILTHLLGACYDFNKKPVVAKEAANPSGSARYFGLRLVDIQSASK
jgi:hypothetical protein